MFNVIMNSYNGKRQRRIRDGERSPRKHFDLKSGSMNKTCNVLQCIYRRIKRDEWKAGDKPDYPAIAIIAFTNRFNGTAPIQQKTFEGLAFRRMVSPFPRTSLPSLFLKIRIERML